MAEQVRKIHSEMGTVRVRKTLFGQEQNEEEYIEVRPFATEPARVRVGRGRTINLGNYDSARLDVSIDMPCYPEEIKAVYEGLTETVNSMIVEESNKVLSGIHSGPQTR